ncbi:MAG TPA: hypothetical protein VFN03_05665 [Trueperaceae bacterium]|nr:hypothetical protein [Trueperaceae bacterium]
MLEDLNAVHGLTKEIERLRAGSEDGWSPEMQSTPGQLWKRLLETEPGKRIEMLRRFLESANEGARCAMEMHSSDLAQQGDQLARLMQQRRGWNVAHRLITVYIGTLRKDRQDTVVRGDVADRLEILLAGDSVVADNNARRILCGHRWTESGRDFECAEPVNGDGLHQGEHYAYVRQGSAADEELRMRYLEDENDELRRRLGLAPNRRRT